MSPDPEDLVDERVGTRIGQYRIESLVGVGGMGQVYRATAGDGSLVALKLVKRDFARDETFRRRFRREARIAQTVHNPHDRADLLAGRRRPTGVVGGGDGAP